MLLVVDRGPDYADGWELGYNAGDIVGGDGRTGQALEVIGFIDGVELVMEEIREAQANADLMAEPPEPELPGPEEYLDEDELQYERDGEEWEHDV